MTSAQDSTLTPSELNRQVRTLLESHYDFLWISGEISNFAAPSSGHWYFSLKDDNAQVRCAMFRGRNQRLGFRPKNGDAVRLRARVSLYESRGEFQLIGEHLEPAGAGALQARFEALRDRLRDEGLFDSARKKPLPQHINHAAIITSPTGAALQDILTVLKRRSPLTKVSVLPSAVQGQEAAPQLCAALARANRLAAGGAGFDVIVLARGGGSLEDLWAFNEESLARAVAASDLPVVSGIGHEVDITIADFAADVRAPTPSAAAELISRDSAEMADTLLQQRRRLAETMRWRLQRAQAGVSQLRVRLRHPGARLREQTQRMDEMELRLCENMQRRLARDAHRLELLRLRLAAASPMTRLNTARRRLDTGTETVRRLMSRRLERATQQLRETSSALENLNPLAVLDRGYAIVTTEAGEVVRDATGVLRGQPLSVRLSRGGLAVEVLTTLEDEQREPG